MPLRRAKSGEPQADIDAVYFPMEDVDTGKPVVCKASYEYLQRRTGVPGDSTGNEMLWAFEMMRDKVEAAVSSLYDAGKAPFLRSDH